MWRDNHTTDSLTQLLDEVKNYIKLEKEYLVLDLVEKISLLLSAVILGFILMCLGIVVLFYLSFTFIYLISPLVGGLTVAFALTTAVLLLFLLGIYHNRKAWILIPITHFVASVLLKGKAADEDIEKEDEL